MLKHQNTYVINGLPAVFTATVTAGPITLLPAAEFTFKSGDVIKVIHQNGVSTADTQMDRSVIYTNGAWKFV